ncbi:integrase catalytic domain-containing protein [Trichonephila clavipes]|nr:integrase catalytic domain-containing protein [Trichonephila clavipes]
MLQNGNHKSLVRALIDTGSQKSYILKSTAENLGFKYEGEEEFVHSLFGGSKTKMYRHKCYNICLTDIHNYYTCNLNLYDQEIICNNVPSIRHGPWINELKNRKINLSDSGHKLGGKIEILLGADVAGKLLTGTMFYLKSGPVAIKTKLGWTLMGKTYRNETKFDKNHFMNVTSMFVNDMCISDLWKLDSLGITDPVETKTKLEIQKETLNHFQKSISVDISGRYEVALPWVLDNKLLSSDRKLAENRLESTKRKLIATGKFEEYQDVLDLWLSGKIIEEVNDDKENFVHYLPHRPVIKENSTKLESQPDNFETMVLGLIWNLKDDCLSCNINCQKNEGKSEGSFFERYVYPPRLELLSCTIGTRLAASVKNDLNLPDVRIYYLTDSMTALAWIQRTRDWGVFVSNRVKKSETFPIPLTVGEVVVVENSLKNRTLWSLARVIQLIPGKDGQVRVARVKTETGELVRPVQNFTI